MTWNMFLSGVFPDSSIFLFAFDQNAECDTFLDENFPMILLKEYQFEQNNFIPSDNFEIEKIFLAVYHQQKTDE